MEKLSMCRVCLGENIALLPIVGTHLQEMYESLVLLPFQTEDGRPILVCYICCARLKNCYELRKSCLQSEELFTQMLGRNESDQVQLQAINNKKRLTIHNAIHLSMGYVLRMDADNVGVEALKREVKDEPNDDQDISEDVLEENSVSDDVLFADSDTKNEENTCHVLEMDADSDGVETLVMLCDVKDEQSVPGDISENDLEENGVSDAVLPADSDTKNEESMGRELKMDADSDGVETLVVLFDVKDEQSDSEGVSTPQELSQIVQSYDNSTSNNLNEPVRDIFEKSYDVTAADITDDNKEITASVQYMCDTCQQCYSSKRELERHVRSCSNVLKKDLSRDNTTSVHTHTARKPHQCHVCNKRFSRIHHLTRHMLAHTNELQYHCHVCKKQFTQKNNLTSHMRTHTGEKPYHCDVCKKQFSQNNHLIEHIRTHTGVKPFHCDICNKRYYQKHHLIEHIRAHTGKKPLHCDICKKQFLAKSILTIHIRTHTGEKPYHCDVCKKQFSQNNHLIEHIRTHTGVKPFHCDICNKRYYQKHHLIEHIRAHTGEKPFNCDTCNKRFSRKDHLKNHMRTHTDEKPYHCEICKKYFSRKDNLKVHMRTHTDEKPYYCDICKKQFSHKGYFSKHMRIHTGENLYHCHVCKKQFLQQGSLSTHMRTHTGEKPYHVIYVKSNSQ